MRRLIALLVATLSAAALAVPCSELPVLFVVQDKSGSMARAPDGTVASSTNPSKWSIATQVVPALASQYGNRFRFGAAMYPHDTTTFNCTTGTVVAPISASSAGVQSAYAAAVPGGGTPTAASLQAVRSHLSSQGLTTTASVLLITDGLPNCNLTLDDTTCPPTTPGCGPTPAASTCGLGPKDCLDSADTVQAARELFNAGVKVFVVGFDSTLTAGNNKAVLDAIASAGGTGSASVASNQAQLTQALNSIASSTATCCKDACTQGAAQCSSSGARQVCQVDASLGCTTWVSQACAAGTTCSNGQCQACANVCTAGATRCAFGDVEQCVATSQGCTEWRSAEVCGWGELCSGAQCTSCEACQSGASRCSGTGMETCERNYFTGCTAWEAQACAAGSVCANGSCATCNGTCTAGAKRCAGNTVESCVADAAGCTRWQAGETCTDFCSGGACGTCGVTCTPGQTRCQGAGVETCRLEGTGCSGWGPAQQCAPNSVCQGGVCAECATACTQGAKRCAANAVTEECRLTSTGCLAWTPVGQCDTGKGERCDVGECKPPCSNECAPGAGRCEAGLPQACQQAPSGCTVWRDEPACASGAVCVAGACRQGCTPEEFDTCATGEVCTGTVDGAACLPEVTDAGMTPPGTGGGAGGGSASGAGGGRGTGAGVDGGGTGIIGAQGVGCGCAALEGGAAPLLALALLALHHRRRR